LDRRRQSLETRPKSPTRFHEEAEFITIEQVASLALFLCSDDAAQITGANLSIDGGWTAA
jgi:NAD(P)-dependent dehydrogenase (short-subunit alcohol dehydrogenase family)